MQRLTITASSLTKLIEQHDNFTCFLALFLAITVTLVREIDQRKKNPDRATKPVRLRSWLPCPLGKKNKTGYWPRFFLPRSRLFGVFMDRDGVEVSKHSKRSRNHSL